jgi:hypothetical protein
VATMYALHCKISSTSCIIGFDKLTVGDERLLYSNSVLIVTDDFACDESSV